ncbi:SDR family NAD(P)-dependent oxidoreductase [Ottowia sp.]|uniref:SDR family NAD(P)-dependent oxidoreductase n=1 Tax=Ottowia sp. TaxID=1898956 RepID=UPI002C5F7112|nr:SDR family NAD(P)-dependent oxidoreductase [Ottowia sp.]HOB65654.1 SDR family NAD(P)-dependent oxidoreductase [Ottowia sp.]HPZ56395.1 SDR family NAD(P)-dependent oxidoreductase [Ottowia sp.]HQD46932.1 SDR family NAD(P)-dependent oxidoreductase [Ottowia sp.]
MTASQSAPHAVVTGAARGIGAAIARALAADGFRLTLLGRQRDTLQALAAELPQAQIVLADVSDAAQVADAFAQARAGFGPITALVNNAGQAHSAPFLKTDAALWQRMLAVNLSGTVHCTQQALPDMLDAGWGRVVNVASTAAQRGYAYVTAYCAAKHGVLGLTRALALEVATKGVTVNAVCPGYTDTDLLQDSVANIVAKTGRSQAQARADLAAGNPQRRLVQPDEVADAVRWLCGASAGSVTGQAISVSGGEVM